MRLGNYTINIGRPALTGIYWWLNIEKRWPAWVDADVTQHYHSKPIFRLQYCAVMPSISVPRGSRHWLKVA